MINQSQKKVNRFGSVRINFLQAAPRSPFCAPFAPFAPSRSLRRGSMRINFPINKQSGAQAREEDPFPPINKQSGAQAEEADKLPDPCRYISGTLPTMTFSHTKALTCSSISSLPPGSTTSTAARAWSETECSV